MTPEEWRKVKEVLEAALELDPAARGGFLDSACAGQTTLRSEVESLLEAHQQDQAFLEQPIAIPAAKLADSKPRSWMGRRVGPYELEEEIGAGGMGEVYRAVRADGAYRKQVAIKLVRAEMGSEFFISRFSRERQILASLEHPHIAHLMDGGVTEEGLPYLVLEFVRGLPIDEYCTRHDLSVAERLKLFRTVCSAVQYAHQNLVVHRDLKPSNILISEDGTPKLVDFGIAKILDAQRVESRDRTSTAMHMMTPDFASPEQVRGDFITAASDIYSLGVILYLLLTGTRPYRVSTTTPAEIIKAICDTDPEKPSRAVTRMEKTEKEEKPDSAAKTLKEAAPDLKRRKLGRSLRGDLDNIVLKALRKSPAERYLTAEQFSEDLRRHLEHRPVLARNDTLGYRMAKLMERHKAESLASLILVVVLLGAGALVLRTTRLDSVKEAPSTRASKPTGEKTVRRPSGTRTTKLAVPTIEFAMTGQMNAARHQHTATVLNDGTVLIAGGFASFGDTASALNTAEIYDPQTGTFTAISPMKSHRGYHAAALLSDGSVLITGGVDHPGHAFPSAEVYDPVAKTFITISDLSSARENHTATVLGDGTVLIVGGYNSSSGPLTSAELYNPLTRSFQASARLRLNVPRYGHTATLLSNGMALISGGFNFITGEVSSAELYDPAAQTFTPTGNQNSARFLHTATLLNDGNVLLAAGVLNAGISPIPTNTSELYDPETGTFTSSGNVTTAAAFHTATLLGNGMVLLAGGQVDEQGTPTSRTELYDPQARTFSPAGNLQNPRHVLTATLLTNGKVLIAGGLTSTKIPVPNTKALFATPRAELGQTGNLVLPSLQVIAVTPVAATLKAGSIQRFIATGIFGDSTAAQHLASVIWSSSDPSIATITNDETNRGMALARKRGTAIIKTCVGMVCGQTTLTVN